VAQNIGNEVASGLGDHAAEADFPRTLKQNGHGLRLTTRTIGTRAIRFDSGRRDLACVEALPPPERADSREHDSLAVRGLTTIFPQTAINAIEPKSSVPRINGIPNSDIARLSLP